MNDVMSMSTFLLSRLTKILCNIAISRDFFSKFQECIGTREVLGETDEVQSSGKVFKKLELGDYRWISYNQLAATAESFGRGLRLLGQEPGTSIAIYAETRAEWMMSCLGAFR